MAPILFICFLFYGPSLNLVGHIRYTELFIIGYFIFTAAFKMRVRFDKHIYTLALLSFLTAIMYLTSGVINNSEPNLLAKDIGSYFLFIFILLGTWYICEPNFNRIKTLLYGYSFSYIVILIIGSPTIRNYHLVPWELGLGMAVTIFVFLIVARSKTLKLWHIVVYLSLGLLHMYLGARIMGAVTIVVTAIMFRNLISRRKFQRLTLFTLFKVALLTIGSVLFVYLGVIYLAENNFLPEGVAGIIISQNENAGGLIVTARASTFASLQSIYSNPLLGVGSSSFSNTVLDYFSEYSGISLQVLEDKNYSKTPAHSHLVSAWADAGLFAALLWIYALAFTGYAFVKLFFWRHPIAALVHFFCIMMIWDILFSPGPHRVDLALKFVFLAWALKAYQLSRLPNERVLVTNRLQAE